MRRIIQLIALMVGVLLAGQSAVTDAPCSQWLHSGDGHAPACCISASNSAATHPRTNCHGSMHCQYYVAKVHDYLAQAKEHEAMIAAFKANSSLSNEKDQASTISHCEYFVSTFKALGDNNQELATLHQWMAKEAPEKVNSTGK